MDLDREETIDTDHDSDEADESFYLSRIMLTEGQPFSPSVISPCVLNDGRISPQLGLLCCGVQSRNAPMTEQIHGTVVPPASSTRVHAVLTKQENSLEREHSQGMLKAYKDMEDQICLTKANTMATRMFEENKDVLTVKPHNVTSNPQPSTSPSLQSLSQEELQKEASLFDKYDLKPDPVLRRSVRKHDKPGKQKIDPERKKNLQCRSLRSQLRNKGQDTKECKKVFNSPLPTHVKQKLRAKPFINPGFRSKGIIIPKTGKVVTLASSHRQNRFGETKVHLAVMQADVQAVKNMIKVGASVNMVDYAGWTPLHEAVDRNNHNMSEILLKAGAQVNCRGDNGITPLHDAIQHGYYKIVNLLLKYGADPLLKCDRGKTPMDMIPDRSMYILVEKYLPNADSKVDSFTADNLRQTTNSAHTRADVIPEHENSLQPVSGPVKGKPSCSPPMKLEVTFKGKVGETLTNDANSAAEKSSSDSFHYHNSDCQITDEGKPSQSVKGDSYKVYSAEGTSAGKRVLEGCEDNCRADVKNDNDSTMAKKKIKKTKHNTQTEKDFLEYLLNFDLNHVSVESKRDPCCPSLQLNENVSEDPQSASCQESVSETLYISDTNNDNNMCSISLLSPHPHVLMDSYLQGSFKENINMHTSAVTVESSLQRKELFDSGSPGSESLLMGIIHNQGITCSPECSDADEPFEKINTCKKQLTVTETLSKDTFTAHLSYHDLQHQHGTVPSTSFAIESTAVDSVSKTPSNTQCLLEPLNQIERVDHQTMSIKHNQQGAILLGTSQTQRSARNADNHSMECRRLIGDKLILNGSETNQSGGPVEPYSSCRETCSVKKPVGNVHLFNLNNVQGLANTCALSPSFSCDVKHQENSTTANCIVVMDTSKHSSDSDCTVVDQLCQSDTVTYIQDVSFKTILNKLSSAEETHSEMGTENKDSTQDTIASVSVLRQLSPKHLCALPSVENIHDTASLNNNGPHMALKDKKLPNTAERKSKKKSKHGKQQNRPLKPNLSKGINEPDVLITAVSKTALKTPQKALHKRNGLGETYLHRACIKGDLQQVKCLIEAGINVNIADNAGWTALHEASVRGFADVVEQLLEAGADVTSRGLDGCTALHDAVKSGTYEIVKLLLQFNSSPHYKNMLGQSALDLAEHESIKELLLTFKGPFRKPGQTTTDSKQTTQLLAAKHMMPVQCGDITVRPSRQIQFKPKCISCCEESTLELSNTTDTSRCQSKMIKTMLEDVERKQNEMAACELRDAKDNNRFNETLSEVCTLLNDAVLKQQEAKNDLTRKFRRASDVFHQGILREHLTDLTSCQKHLLTVLQKQKELKQKVRMAKDHLITSKNISTPVFDELDVSQHCEVISEKPDIESDCTYFSHTALHPESHCTKPFTPGLSKLSSTAQCLPQPADFRDFSGNRQLISLIKDGIIQYGDNNLEMAFKGSIHKASLLQNGSIKDASGRVFFLPEHWVESVLGNNIPVTSDFAWKKVMYQSKSLWDYASNTNSNMEAPKGSVQSQCLTFNISTAGHTLKETSRNEVFMNIKSIQLISNEEFFPSHMMNRYWDLFKKSDEWTLFT